MQKELAELVNKLKEAAGNNLKCVVLYGSAVSGEFHPKHSDLNVLCVLERLDASDLEKLNPASAWWTRKGHPAPVVFSVEELRQSADVFAIELLDIKASHRVLFGEDVFAALDVPMSLHHLQVERELRTNLIRLRQRYLAAPRDGRSLLRLMTESISTFAALFRHVLIAFGEQTHRKRDAPEPKREAIDRLAVLLAFDASAFHTVLDVREGKRREKELNIVATFRAYLDGITRVAREVDQRLNETRKIQ